MRQRMGRSNREADVQQQGLRRFIRPMRWLELLFITGFLLTTLVFHYQTSSSNTSKDIYALWFAPCFLALGLFEFFRQGHAKTRIRYVFGALFLYFLYAALRAASAEYSSFAWQNWRLMAAWVLPVLPAYILAAHPRSGPRLLTAGLAATCVACVYALMQSVAYTLEGVYGWGKGIDPVNWPWHAAPILSNLMVFLETDLRRFAWQSFPGMGPLAAACSTFGNPTYFAGFLSLVIPLISVLALWGRVPAWKRTARVLLVLALASLIAAASKGGALGLFGGVGTLLLLLSFTGAEGAGGAAMRRLRWIGAAMLVAGAVALVTLYALVSPLVGGLEKELSSARNRAIVYSATLDLIRDHLLVGVGPGNFAIQFPSYLEGKMAEEFGWNESLEEKVLDHAHNEYLEVLAELGLIGFLLYAAVLGGGILWMVGAIRSSGDRRLRIVLAGVLAGVVGMSAESLVSVSLRWIPSAWTFWAMFGAGLGLAARIRCDLQPVEPRNIGVGWAVGLAAAALVVASPFTVSRLTADWRFVSGKVAVAQRTDVAERELLRAVELDPMHAQAHYLLGGNYFTQGDYRSSIDHFERVREIRGDVVVLAENMATAYFKLSVEAETETERQEALLESIRIYEECLDRHPGFARLEDYLARAYFRLGLEYQASLHRKRAIDLYERWFAWPGSYPRPNYALDLAKNYLLEDEREKAFWQLRNAWRWKGDPTRVQTVLDSLFQIDATYRDKWKSVLAKDAQAASTPD